MSGAERKKPKFAEAMTQARHANTVIRRLASQSGVRHLPLADESPDPLDQSEQTVLRDPLGYGGSNLPEGNNEVTDPALVAAERPGPSLSAGPIVERNLGSAPSATGATHGKVLVVFGCRGGAGATTVAINLGAELTRAERGSVVVDLDLQMGDVLCALDLAPTATIAELLTEIDELDEASLRRRLTPHRSGLFALSQGDRFDQLEALRPDRIPALLVGLSRQFGTVIVDGLRDFSDLSISALDMADKIILVVPEDVVGVKNASRCLEVFRRLGYGEQKIALVVNRHDDKAKVTPAAIAGTLKLHPLAVLAEDASAAQQALDEGVPVAQINPRSPLVRTLGAMAERLGGVPPQAPVGRGGLLGLMGSLFGGKR